MEEELLEMFRRHLSSGAALVLSEEFCSRLGDYIAMYVRSRNRRPYHFGISGEHFGSRPYSIVFRSSTAGHEEPLVELVHKVIEESGPTMRRLLENFVEGGNELEGFYIRRSFENLVSSLQPEVYREVWSRTGKILEDMIARGMLTEVNSSLLGVPEEEQARELFEENQETLGLEHPSTLTTMHRLAVVLDRQGESEQARELFEQTLELRRRSEELGPEHPDTLTTMHHLAGVLHDQGESPRARELLEQVLELRQRSEELGPEHPDTLAAMHLLALVLRALGEEDQAHDLLAQVRECRGHEVLGTEDSPRARMEDIEIFFRPSGDHPLFRASGSQDVVMGRVLWSENPTQAERDALYDAIVELASSIGSFSHTNLRTVLSRAAEVQRSLNISRAETLEYFSGVQDDSQQDDIDRMHNARSLRSLLHAWYNEDDNNCPERLYDLLEVMLLNDENFWNSDDAQNPINFAEVTRRLNAREGECINYYYVRNYFNDFFDFVRNNWPDDDRS